MSCDGHRAHPYETSGECGYCGHPRDEHTDDFWDEAANERATAPDEPAPGAAADAPVSL